MRPAGAHHVGVRRRTPEPEITRQDMEALTIFLMGMDAKIDEIHSFLIEEDDEEEDPEGS